MNKIKGIPFTYLLLFFSVFLLYSCHSTDWNAVGSSQVGPAPQAIRDIFAAHPGGIILSQGKAPGDAYIYDIGEKDEKYSDSRGAFLFESVEIHLRNKMPKGKVLVDFAFVDQKKATTLRVPGVDLIRLTPKMDMTGDMWYPEVILEELNRFGVSFRKEHNEFSIESSEAQVWVDRAYRVSITNNCLDPGKFEMSITSEDLSDFEARKNSGMNLNQNRILSHTWFPIPLDLYGELLEMKNPGNAYPVACNFDSISNIGEQVVIDYSQLRNPIRQQERIKILEIGHQSGRKLVPIDLEQHYKKLFGLYLDQPREQTYASILDENIQTAKFMNEGFYREDTPRKFDFSFLKQMDSVVVSTIDVNGSDCYAEIKLTGKYSWFEITIGNLDLSQIDEQKYWGMLFGFNTYPKSRRYHPQQNTILYDAEMLPDEIKPYVLMTEKNSGKWVNNQYKGLEKVLFSYETREKDVLEIYVLSYERITPVWMARVKLPKGTREAVRVRNALYAY